MDFKLNYNYKKISTEKLLEFFEKDFVESLCMRCPNYSKIWSCPSFNLDIVKYFSKYRYAYIIGAKVYYKDVADYYNSDDDLNKIINDVYNNARSIFDKQLLNIELDNDDSKALYAGRCMICEKCSREDNKPCLHYDKMRYSLEALGINVSSITENVLEDKILWNKDGLPEYCLLIGAVLSNKDYLAIELP